MKFSDKVINILSGFYFLMAAFWVYYLGMTVFIAMPADGLAIIAVPFVTMFLVVSLVQGYGIYKRKKIIYFLTVIINILLICLLSWGEVSNPPMRFFGYTPTLPIIVIILITLPLVFIPSIRNQFFKK